MRTLRRLACLLGWVMVAAVSSASAGTEEDLQQLFAAGDFPAALVYIDKALKKEKSDFKLLLAKGFTLVKMKRLDEAAKHYKQLKKSFPDGPGPGNNLAMVYRLQGNFGQAIKLFNQTIEDFPAYARAYENLGDTYILVALYQYQLGYQQTSDALFANKIQLSRDFQQLAALPPAASRLLDVSPDNQVNWATPVFGQADVSEASAPIGVPAPATVVETGAVKPQTVDAGRAVLASLETWSNDWMSRDTERYFSNYAAQFVPEKGQTMAQWKVRKTRILAASKSIDVLLSDVSIKFNPGNDTKAFVQFIQKYQSSTLTSTSTKKMVLRKQGDRWLIVKETSI